ncbi:carboxypeptidase-like regulatory domain-containing protein, partial [Priestia megaterium]
AGVVTVITGSGIIVASAKTDLNGNYIISGLAPGSYDVVISADNFAAQTSTVNLRPNETEIVNTALSPNPATVSGRVTNAGTGVPIANALIQAFTIDGTFVTSTLSDVAGSIPLQGCQKVPLRSRLARLTLRQRARASLSHQGKRNPLIFPYHPILLLFQGSSSMRKLKHHWLVL